MTMDYATKEKRKFIKQTKPITGIKKKIETSTYNKILDELLKIFKGDK